MSVKNKVLLLAILPVVFIVFILTIFTIKGLNDLGEKQISEFEKSMLESKSMELKNYMEIAYSLIREIYENDDSGDPVRRELSQEKVKDILRKLRFDRGDGYVFVYNFDGINLVLPPKPELEGKDLSNLKDKAGRYLIKDLIEIARDGGGYYKYIWPKPSKNKDVEKYSYVIPLKKWGWWLGTGIYIDDIEDATNKVLLNTKSIRKSISVKIFLTALIMLLFVAILTYYFSTKIAKGINLVKDFLKTASEKGADLTVKIPKTSEESTSALSEISRTISDIQKMAEDLKMMMNEFRTN